MQTVETTTSSPNSTNAVLCAVLLREIKAIVKKDYNESDWDEWDGKVSFSGIKRMIYGIWNEGKNEKNEDMTCWMSPTAKKMYRDLIDKYKGCQKVYVSL